LHLTFPALNFHFCSAYLVVYFEIIEMLSGRDKDKDKDNEKEKRSLVAILGTFLSTRARFLWLSKYSTSNEYCYCILYHHHSQVRVMLTMTQQIQLPRKIKTQTLIACLWICLLLSHELTHD